jgi:hypothetical protein
VGPLNPYRFSLTPNGPYTTSLSIPQPGGTFNQVVYVKLFGVGVSPTVHNGNIQINGGGIAAPINVAVTGTTFLTSARVTTKAATNISATTATLNGRVIDQGCSNVNFYGFFYYGAPGTPTVFPTGKNYVKVGNFISNNTYYTYDVTGLLPNTTYYVKAFAQNLGETGFGAELSFKTAALPAVFTSSPNPVKRGDNLNFSMLDLKQRYFGVEIYNSAGQQVLRRNFNVQNGFINDHVVIPIAIPVGVYHVRVVNDTEVLEKRTILVVN